MNKIPGSGFDIFLVAFYHYLGLIHTRTYLRCFLASPSFIAYSGALVFPA